jgi:voltage-gated potassium channel
MHKALERIVGPVPGIRWLVLGMVVISVACALVARLIADEDFPTFGRALWWSVQTVTTVGYGDVTPESTSGRAVAAVLMVSAIAFISVLTAAISAGFVRRVQVRRGAEDPLLEALRRIEARLAALEQTAAPSAEASSSRPGTDG